MNSTSQSASHLDKLRRYLKALETGAFSDVTDLFSPNMVMQQLPNRIYPKGIRSGVAEMAGAFEKGRKLLSSQSYEIRTHVIEGDTLAAEVLWTGTLAIAFGALEAGSQMRAHSAMFLEFREGRIVAQRNYDCFEPW